MATPEPKQTENLEKGLTSAQVSENREKFGRNILQDAKKESILKKLFLQLTEITSLILLFAVALSAYMAISYDGGWTKPIVIGSIVVLNVLIGLYQEHSAEKSLAALRDMSEPTANVIRGGTTQKIAISDVVVGDIITLNAGDQVPADGELKKLNALNIDEAILTGESEPVEKTTKAPETVPDSIGDQVNKAFSGTLVTHGTGTMIVSAVGMKTEIGKIADLLNSTKRHKTVLQRRLSRLSLIMTFIAIVSGIFIFFLSTLHELGNVMDNLMIGVSLAVAAVPETLPVIVTISLSVGVQNMAKRNAIIRRLNSVETLGSVDVIASDKTGTLTQNKMTITRLWSFNNRPENIKVKHPLSDSATKLMRLFALDTNAVVEEDHIEGDATELAIIRLLHQHHLSREHFEQDAPRISERPFSSERKTMSTLHKLKNGHFLLIVKGALDKLPITLPDSDKQKINKIHDEFANDALRVLGVAYREFEEEPQKPIEDLEEKLTFAGIIGLIDPPRPEAKKAVRQAKSAGIKTIMITGDHKTTARAIATQIGIYQKGDLAVSGADLTKWDDKTLNQKIDKASVFARVSPEDKIRIVKAWQQQGKVVAMTGDGVNDAPALKAADVGIAMGITGTEVAKGASDLILTDDNFATIIAAVSSGRTIYQNVLKAIEFLVSVNFAQIFLMVGSVLFGWGVPLIAEQLLLINVLADGIPGFYLSREQGEAGAMRQSPIPSNQSIFSNGVGSRMFIRSMIYTVLTLSIYALGRFILTDNNSPVGATMLFLTLSMGSMIDIYPIKTREPLTLASIKSNHALNIALLIAAAIIVLVALIPPLQSSFGLVQLSPFQWTISLMAMFIPTILLEINKKIQLNLKG
ncbi:cation transport ATPase [Liquorilactobacillus aquaticus DSM 21051]|uniref:Cation transport ATPase n=1 Tax=Liquorilactobacillus aquaticus DSM 21051 TaxID=1423725 RepID=A0A0R2D0A3_9LACO|nr:cation-translocating P-type ATPase [Liquorilactobacillus aquaticus]KRM95316.1 cation transport ATPase [Liquorilactobacillus aquaticus DSM 21051]